MQSTVIERVKRETDIVEIVSKSLTLTKKGNNFFALCPFHGDKNPSLIISKQKQIFKCFSCGQGGDVITFVSNFEKISYQEAVKKLGVELGITIESDTQTVSYNETENELLNVLNDANNFFMNALMLEKNTDVLNYALKRGLDDKIREKFKIGFCENNEFISYLKIKKYDEAILINASLVNKHQSAFFQNRLMFAIANHHGDIVGFSGRNLTVDPSDNSAKFKYLNSSDSLVFNKSNFFYNWFNAKATIEYSGEVFVVEGFMDVIAFDRIKIFNVVALMGTNFSNYQLNILKCLKVILMLDQDQAGVGASIKVVLKLIKAKINVEIIENTTLADPDEMFFQDQGKTLQRIVKKRLSWIEYIYRLFCPQKEVKTANEINDFVKLFKPFWILANELEQAFYLNKISAHFQLSKEIIKNLFIDVQSKVNSQFELPMEKASKFTSQTFEKKPKNLKPIFKINAKNYDHLLIRSMLKNPQFITIFKNHHIMFEDKILSQISEIFYQYPKIINSSQIVKTKCLEILAESSEIATSNEEFEDYIERIKWINQNQMSQKIIDSIKQINNPQIALKLLEEQIKLKRGK